MSLKPFSFNTHNDLRGTHAIFSPSQSSFLRYDDEKVIDKIVNQYRAALGSEIHEFASREIPLNHRVTNARNLQNQIESYIYNKYYSEEHNVVTPYGEKLLNYLGYMPREVYDTLKFYINDAVGFKMTVEQPLVYPGFEDYIRGTTDAICFRNKLLRIHDLKTGSHKADVEQLEVYAALFCLEYNIKPADISYELRLYQIDGIEIFNPTVEDILPAVDAIIGIGRVIKESII